MIDYIKKRLAERSTMGDIAAAFIAASAIPSPWNVAVALALIGKALIPDKKVEA